MKAFSDFKHLIVVSVSYATALLFTYAAVSKLIDFENFQVQLGQSPLLSAFAQYISYVVPISEIILAIALSNSKYRKVALKASYLLMILFTTYIYVIINFSAFVPCSCGGVLEKMTWSQHLAFNIIFIIALLFAIMLFNYRSDLKYATSFINAVGKRLFEMCIITICGILIIIMVFKWSDQVIQYSNTLIRRMPPHAAQLEKQFDLKVNSYYFAGSFEGKIFLGNSTAPLIVTEIDTALKSLKVHKIVPRDKSLPFKTPEVRVFEETFFLFEGNVPYIFRGSTANWYGELLLEKGDYFSKLEPIDKNLLAVRFIAQNSGQSILGTINLLSNEKIKLESLLQTQLDGIFDVDGSLHYDKEMKYIVYVHRYRNEFIVAKENLKLEYRGNTIDTISKVQIGLREVKTKQLKTFSEPPLIVNKMSAVSNGILYVNSSIPGKFDNLNLWSQASIIDVYDLKDKSYQASFPIYKMGKHKMKSFIVTENKVFVLIENQIVSYNLLNHLLAKTEYRNRGNNIP
jgi:hypothetical protein